MYYEFDIEGGNFSKAGLASSEVKKKLRQLNVDNQVVKRVVVALYEAEVNIVAHAYNGTMEVEIDDAIAQRGQEISTQEGCIACHTVDGSLGVGPSWQGMMGRIETLEDGTSIVVDEEYFRESIRYANRKMVAGYPRVMPSYLLEEEDLLALIAFAQRLSQ